MQGGLVRKSGLPVCPSVCLSVCLSVNACSVTKEERTAQIFIPYKRLFSVVFWKEKWLVGATPSTWNFVSTGSRWSEIADFQPIFARSASAVTHIAKKSSINTNRKSTTRFLMSLKWSSYVAPKPTKEVQRRKTFFYHFGLAASLCWYPVIKLLKNMQIPC